MARTAVLVVILSLVCIIHVAAALPDWWPHFRTLPQVRDLYKKNSHDPLWERGFAEFMRRSMVELQREPGNWRQFMPSLLAQVLYYSEHPIPSLLDYSGSIPCGYLCSKWLGYKKHPGAELPITWDMVMPYMEDTLVKRNIFLEESQEAIIKRTTGNGGPRDIFDVVNTTNCVGMETAIKGQGPCEGCWAYASADLLTLSFCYNNLSTASSDLSTQASVQAILDCSASAMNTSSGELNAGCAMGDPGYALKLSMGLVVTTNLPGTGGTRGIPNGNVYPLTILNYADGKTGVRTSGQCLFRQDQGYQFYFGPDAGIYNPYPMTFVGGPVSELGIKNLFALGVAPVLTSIQFAMFTPPYASNNCINMIRHDNLTGCPIPNQPIDHVLLIIGYGYATADIDGPAYAGTGMWKLRNSWSVTWGEGGNAHIQANFTNDFVPGGNVDYWGHAACSIGFEAWGMLPPNVNPNTATSYLQGSDATLYNSVLPLCDIVGRLP